MQTSLRTLASSALLATSVALAPTLRAQEALTVVSIQASTGALAYGGIFFQNSIRMAIDEVNANGGIHGANIHLIERDNGSDKAQSINLANQAIDRDRALLVFGPTSTSSSVAAAPVFSEKRTPNLSFATSDALLKVAGSWSFKFQQSPGVINAVLAQYVLNKTPIRRVAFVFDRSNEAWHDAKNTFLNPFKAGGGTVVTEQAILTSDTNFQPLATKLNAMNIDAVHIAAYPEQSANIILQLRQAGMGERVRFIGAVGMVSPNFMHIVGKAGEGAITVADHVTGLVDRPLNKAFEAAYQRRYGSAPDTWAAVGYSLALVGIAALQEAGPKPTRAAVRDAITRLRDVPMLGGDGLWNRNPADGKPYFGAVVLTVQDGKYVLAP